MGNDIALSTGKLCPRCGCQSLLEGYSVETVIFEKNYICVAKCGMQFALNRIANGKIKLYYHKYNELYLAKRFKFRVSNTLT